MEKSQFPEENFNQEKFMTDFDFMNRAIQLALLGKGWTNPNPLVGAVIVKDGKIIAEGFHHKCGELHAERDALKNAAEKKADVSGSTIFVTLEPCCHTGRQPPCTQAIIESGIKKVVIGSRDPNPKVNGKGVKILEEAGIQVVQDFMKEECDSINSVFFHFIRTKMPYVTLKYAVTMDGETACSSGESRWITGEKARRNVHLSRSCSMAVMTGIGTVLKDDPMMNVRLDSQNFRQPVRVVLDSDLRIPEESQIVKSAEEIPVIVFCKDILNSEEKSKKSVLERKCVKIFQVKYAESDKTENSEKNSELDIKSVLKILGEQEIDSVFVESGGRLSSSLLFPENFVNEVHVYIAPKIFGNDGHSIFSPVRGKGINFPSDCVKFSKPEVEFFDEDILLKYKK